MFTTILLMIASCFFGWMYGYNQAAKKFDK